MAIIDFITAIASDFSAVVEHSADGTAKLSLPLKLADGNVVPLKLVVKACERTNEVFVREDAPGKFPSFCPERHINFDGTFCLYLPGVETIRVVDHETAAAWWETVWKFLKLQVRATALRRWPNGDVWAHGTAAVHQRLAQNAAQALGSEFVRALTASRLTVERHGARRWPAGPTLRVFNDDVHIFSVWETSERLVNLKRRCFCRNAGLRTPKKIRSCEDHANQAVVLALALRDWEIEEKRFWAGFKNVACCGTCDVCPLLPRPP